MRFEKMRAFSEAAPIDSGSSLSAASMAFACLPVRFSTDSSDFSSFAAPEVSAPMRIVRPLYTSATAFSSPG